jgi:hypothetical protein
LNYFIQGKEATPCEKTKSNRKRKKNKSNGKRVIVIKRRVITIKREKQ